MIRWLDEVIGKLDGATLDIPAADDGKAEPLVESPERPSPDEASPSEATEAPSSRDFRRAGDRSSRPPAEAPRLDVTQIERELADRASASLDGDDLALARWSGLGSLGGGLDEWYYGPEYDDAAREERANLSRMQRAERRRWFATQAGRVEPGSDRHSDEGSNGQEPGPLNAGPPDSNVGEDDGTPLRRLTPAGVAHAQEFLAHLREHPDADREPPRALLYDDQYSRPVHLDVRVEPQSFTTRRDAGEYFGRKFEAIATEVSESAGIWSWLGMYYLVGTAPESLSPNNMTFLFEPESSSAHAKRTGLQRYRHYLWGSWRLYSQHGDGAAFLLDQDITSWDDIAQRTFGSWRVFNSRGVVALVLRLYTQGQRKKRGHVASPGGLRHLLRILPQLELTYDVYGMEPDALLQALPPPFHEWATKEA